MGLGLIVLGLIIVIILMWIIIPDPVPVIDDVILIPIAAILIMKFSKAI